MKVEIELRGDERVIVLPKAALKQCKPGDELQMDVLKGALLIRACRDERRSQWRARLKEITPRGRENLLIEEPTGADMDDWEW